MATTIDDTLWENFHRVVNMTSVACVEAQIRAGKPRNVVTD